MLLLRAQAAHADADRIDADGLPHVGAVAYPDQAYYSALDQVTGAPARLSCRRWHGGAPVMRSAAVGILMPIAAQMLSSQLCPRPVVSPQ